jgi:hypothetical protein
VTTDDNPVPKPGEANRDTDDIHYHDTDETNVSETSRPPKPAADDPQPDHTDHQ